MEKSPFLAGYLYSLPQSLKSMFIEIFLNGGPQRREPGVKNCFSNYVNLSLWVNCATTQKHIWNWIFFLVLVHCDSDADWLTEFSLSVLGSSIELYAILAHSIFHQCTAFWKIVKNGPKLGENGKISLLNLWLKLFLG